VIAQTRGEEGHEWGVLLCWKDGDNRIHEQAFSKKLFAASDGKALIEHLLDRGLNITPNGRHRQFFLAYLQKVNPPCKATSVSKVGWKDQHYMLHDGCIPHSDDIFLQNAAIEHGRFKPHGSLPQWQEQIGRYIAGNSRLTLFACAAFAAPLLKLASEKEGGGFHLYGGTSVGKSTALEVAASIWGDQDYIHQWRNTDNAFEAIALAHNDGLLCLDELHQVDPNRHKRVGFGS
jgi:putative DNA primase/helicase